MFHSRACQRSSWPVHKLVCGLAVEDVRMSALGRWIVKHSGPFVESLREMAVDVAAIVAAAAGIGNEAYGASYRMCVSAVKSELVGASLA